MMCLRSNRILALLLLLLPLSLSAAEYGNVPSAGTGKDLAEAMASAVRAVAIKQVKAEQGYLKAMLHGEILPQASSFITSYKILEDGKSGFVNITAQVDADVLRAFFTLTPKALGIESDQPAKIVIVLKGPKIEALEKDKEKTDYYQPFALLAREKLQRRGFESVFLDPKEIASLSEDISPESVRTYGAKAEAQLALGLILNRQFVENENTHQEEERIYINGALVDVKGGRVLAKHGGYFLVPRVRRESLKVEFERVMLEEGKDVLREIFVHAGEALAGGDQKQDLTVLRIQDPMNGTLIQKFKAALDGSRDWKSFLEYRVQRGRYDFAVRPAIKHEALLAKLKALNLEDVEIVLPQEPGDENAPLVIQLKPKMNAQPQNAMEKESYESH